MWRSADENLSYLCLGATSLLIPNAQVNKGSSAKKRDCQNLCDCEHGKKKLVANRCCWLWVALPRFDSF